MHAPCILGLSGSPRVVEDLNPVIVGIHDVDVVISVYENACWEIEIPWCITIATEIVEELSCVIERLNDAPQSINDIQTLLAIEGDSFGTEHAAGAVARIADLVMKLPRAA